MPKISENTLHSCMTEKEMYQTMYQNLFHKISRALSILESGEVNAVVDAIQTLKNAQCDAEEKFIRTSCRCVTTRDTASRATLMSNKDLPSEPSKRPDLQSVSCFHRKQHITKYLPYKFDTRKCPYRKHLENSLRQFIGQNRKNRRFSCHTKGLHRKRKHTVFAWTKGRSSIGALSIKAYRKTANPWFLKD